MRLIMIPDIADRGDRTELAGLRQALSAHPLNVLMTEAAQRAFCQADDSTALEEGIGSKEAARTAWVMPPQWHVSGPAGGLRIVHTGASAVLDNEIVKEACRHPWLILSNGRFVTQVNLPLLNGVLAKTGTDVVAIRVSPELRAHQERVRLTPEGELVGCRRLYRDVAEPAPIPADWPHHLFVKASCAEKILGAAATRDFGEVLATCRACGLKIRSFAIAGMEIDLASSQGLLALAKWMLSLTPPSRTVSSLLYDRSAGRAELLAEVSAEARLAGPVLMGKGVRVEAGAVVVGPTVLCEHSTIGPDSLVDASIVGPGIAVDRGRGLAGSCELSPQASKPEARGPADVSFARHATGIRRGSEFRTWPKFSYARCFKRIADFIAAIIVLALFAPIIPFIALAVRISSPGPVFYKDRRQGLHGRPFHCIKFRTMRVGAAEIQDKLRFVSEVDGPQFKINDDPRISSVGHFLRETSIDEIPQFFNVLVGQMSVVGPRPSPEAENTQCPSWRDARLSVRPGITGLWQVSRTRRPYKDFQEWIYYDTKYVSGLSLRNDLQICGQTFKRLLWTFVEQF
jgi:lipopolysaccharide/colanic/teichoic acid biosynthesis glycosyltransferase